LDAAKLYIQIYSAIVGGSVWLSMGQGKNADYAFLSDLIVILLAIIVVVRIIDNIQSWLGYRELIGQLKVPDGSPPIKKPNLLQSGWTELTSIIGIIISAGLFLCYNPFQPTTS
jgi:hypothetical protein